MDALPHRLNDDDNQDAQRNSRDPLRCVTCAARHTNLCANLEDEELEDFFKSSTRMTLDEGASIVCEGDASESVYNVSDGVFMMSRLGADGRRQVLSFLFTGDFIGVVSTKTYGYSIDAVTGGEMCRFERPRFDALLDKHPDAAKRYRDMTARMLESSYELAFTLGQKSATERMAAFLLFLRDREITADAWHGRLTARAKDGTERIRVPMSRTDIADFLGLKIETVSRALKTLRDDGIVRNAGAHDLDVTDMASLRRLAQK